MKSITEGFLAGAEIFCHCMQISSGAHPASYQMGTEGSFPKVKKVWSYTSTSPYIFMAWYIIKHRIHLYGVVLSQAQGQLYLLPLPLEKLEKHKSPLYINTKNFYHLINLNIKFW
jgi:hypothetical protein